MVYEKCITETEKGKLLNKQFFLAWWGWGG